MLYSTAHAQSTESTETLFGPNMELGFVWGGNLQFNTIQEDVGSFIGFYGGALLAKRFLIGLTVGANVGHPYVNYGQVGLLAQYTADPGNLIHWSGQIIIGTGGTKDYEQDKSNLMDNFGNTTGAGYYYFEPGVNGELNLSESVRLVMGLSYRTVFGLSENTKFTERTHVTADDMSGLNFNLGVKIGSYN